MAAVATDDEAFGRGAKPKTPGRIRPGSPCTRLPRGSELSISPPGRGGEPVVGLAVLLGIAEGLEQVVPRS